MPFFRPRANSSSSSSKILRNITIDDSDSSLVYSQGWTKSSSSNAFGGGFSTTSQVGDIVQFFLPQGAVAIYYNGFKQTGGGICGVCLDCDAKGSGNLQTINSHSTTNDDAPTTLFSKMDIDPNTKHSFSLVNFPDASFDDKGTTTVDSFIITIQEDASQSASVSIGGSNANIIPNSESTAMPLTDIATGSASVTISQTSTTTSDPTTSSTASSTSSADGSSASHTFSNDTASAKSGVSKSPVAIAGIAVACLLVGTTIVYALMYFMRRRRRKRNAPFSQINEYKLPPKESVPRPPSPPLPMQMEQQAFVTRPVTVPAPAASASTMGMTSPRSENPFSDPPSAGMATPDAQDSLYRVPSRESPRPWVPASPPPRALTPGIAENASLARSRTFDSSPLANDAAITSPAPTAKRPETEYIENPFLAAEVEARTRALLAERGYNPQHHHHHHHQTQSLDRFDHASEQGRAQDFRPVSTMTMNPLPMPNLHEERRKNSWELL